MHASEARAQLLREHQELRGLVERALSAAAGFRSGAVSAGELRQALDDLRHAFAAHNASEEALLRPILAVDPSWGPARIARMLEEHGAEHAAMRAALGGDDDAVATTLPDLAEDIDAHMEAEERTFLSASVLGP